MLKYKLQVKMHIQYPAGNYMFKVNNRNTRKKCERFSKLTIKTPLLLPLNISQTLP